MKSCKSLSALRDYFKSKENSDVEVIEEREIQNNCNPLNFLSDFVWNTKGFAN